MKVINDGKGKRQSWEAAVSDHGAVADGFWSVSADGFGADYAEARRNLRAALRAAIEALERADRPPCVRCGEPLVKCNLGCRPVPHWECPNCCTTYDDLSEPE